jgi:hypothetical protein
MFAQRYLFHRSQKPPPDRFSRIMKNVGLYFLNVQLAKISPDGLIELYSQRADDIRSAAAAARLGRPIFLVSLSQASPGLSDAPARRGQAPRFAETNWPMPIDGVRRVRRRSFDLRELRSLQIEIAGGGTPAA